MASLRSSGWGCLSCSEFDKFLKLCREKTAEAIVSGNKGAKRFWREQRDYTLGVWAEHLEVYHQLPLPLGAPDDK